MPIMPSVTVLEVKLRVISKP